MSIFSDTISAIFAKVILSICLNFGELSEAFDFFLPIQLRPANHNYRLPVCKYELYKRSFIVRSLFNFNFNYQ